MQKKGWIRNDELGSVSSSLLIGCSIGVNQSHLSLTRMDQSQLILNQPIKLIKNDETDPYAAKNFAVAIN